VLGPDVLMSAVATLPISVLLVDGNSLFRRGVNLSLREAGLNVVGEATSGEDAVKAVAHLAPDVVVLDINLRGQSGIEAAAAVIERFPQTGVVAFTTSRDDDCVLRAIAAGARGYLLKDAPMEDLVDAIRAVAAGGSSISPRAAAPLLRELRAHADETAMVHSLPFELSDREVAVLKLLTRGVDNTGIADALFLSRATVKNHISAILEKLGVENRVQAAVCAVRAGIS
jgi:DNA-binding NarL/FixJ family response regulator